MLSESDVKMIKEPNIAFISTLNKDGSSQVTPVWVDMEDDLIVFTTQADSVKNKNVTRDKRVAVTLVDRNDPYKCLGLKGAVVDQTTDNADNVLDSLSKKYIDQDVYPFRKPGATTILVKIRPEKKYVVEE